jgi:hypothetical protein
MTETPDPVDQLLAEAKAQADRSIAAREAAWRAWPGRRSTPIFGTVVIVSVIPLVWLLVGATPDWFGYLSLALAATAWYLAVRAAVREAFLRGWYDGGSHQRWREVERRQSADDTLDRIMRLRRMGPGGGEVT